MRWVSLATAATFVLLMVVDVFPREAAFFVLGFLLIVVLLLPLRDAFWIAFVSVPLSVALPLKGADTLAVWRIIVAALFLRWLWRSTRFRPSSMVFLLGIAWQSWLFRLFVGFLGWGAVTLLWAPDTLFGVRQLLFLVNAALFFPVVFWSVQRHRQMVRSAALTAVGLVAVVGYAQWIVTSHFILERFWVFWAEHVIPVFFGDVLGTLLLVSNTWFAYFADDTATLRMFSLLPDSHSFGLFMAMGLAVVGGATLAARGIGGRLGWVAVIATILMAVILSGTRGLWVAFPAMAAVFFFVWFFGLRRVGFAVRKRFREGFLVVLGITVLFAALFPLSGPLLSIPSEGDGGDIDALRRARSSFDLSELSVKGRLEIWQATWHSFLKRPLRGVGYGNFAVILERDADIARFGASAHSLYFNMIAETGIVGGGLGIGFLLVAVWRAIRSWARGSLSVAYPAVLVWVVAYGLFDVVLLNDRVLLLFVVLLGFTIVGEEGPDHHNSINDRLILKDVPQNSL